jgi:integrase
MPKISSTRLTDTLVKNIRPQAARFEVFDAQVPGFGLRIAPTGRKTWIAFGRQNGKRVRATLGTYPQIPLAEARNAAIDALRQMRDGTYNKSNTSMLFEDVVELWYAREQRARKSFRQVENAMSLHVVPHLQGKEIKAIRKSDLVIILDKVADRGAKTQANRVRAFLTRFFNWCCERDLLENSPASSLPKIQNEISRDRVLSSDELSAVWNAAAAAGYPFGPIVRLLILTGQRRDEVARLSWDEINLDDRIWTIPAARTKNTQKHVVHLSQAALKVLTSLPQHNGCTFAFTTNHRTAVSGFSQAKARIDRISRVTDWRLHDLRRTVATHMAEKLSVSPAVVEKILNHRSGSVTGVAAIYQRGQFLEGRKAALECWGQYVEGLSQVSENQHKI